MTDGEIMTFVRYTAVLLDNMKEMERLMQQMFELYYRRLEFFQEQKKEFQYFLYELIDMDDETKEENEPCFVYYILNQEKDKVKIGISNNPVGRAKNIQTSSGEEIEILHTIQFPSRREALDAESYLHNYFGYCRKKPTKVSKSCEWFDSKICDELMGHFATAEQIERGQKRDYDAKVEAMQKVKMFC